MTKTIKPTAAQLRLIAAILERGGSDVPGTLVFGKEVYGVKPEHAMTTVRAALGHGWIARTERSGVAYWTVTDQGRSAA